MKLLVLWVSVACVLFAMPAKGQEPLFFKPPTAHYKDRIVLDFVRDKQQKSGPFHIARTDLDGNGVDDYIVRTDGPLPFYHFTLVSLKRRIPEQLGTVEAKDLVVSDKKNLRHARASGL